MPSTYSTNLRFELMANGENDATWGTLANQIFNMIEDAISEVVVVTHNDAADYTLTRNDGTADEARCAVLQITGALTNSRNVVCPTADKVYIVHNATTGGHAITIKTAAGSGVSVPNGARTLVYCDGTNVVSAISQLASLSLATALPITSGGTGSTSAVAARTALGLVIGTDVQAYDADLAAIAALSTTSYGRGFLTQADAAAARTYIGATGDVAGPASATNNAIALFDGTTGKTIKDSTYTITAFGASLIDDANAAAARSTLGLVIGTNVLAFDAGIQALSGLTPAADRLPYYTGSGTSALATFTAFGRSLVDDADATAARTTLGLGTSATVNTGTSGATIPLLNGANTWGSTNRFNALVTLQNGSDRVFDILDSGGIARGYIGVAGVDGAAPTNALRLRGEGGVFLSFNGGGGFSLTAANAATLGGNAVWHAGNDGAGSGLDADLLDGLQASAFGQLSAANTWPLQQAFSTGIRIDANIPYIDLFEADAGSNNRWWRWVVEGGTLTLGALNDAAAQTNLLQWTRSGDMTLLSGTLLAPLRRGTNVSGTLTRADHANRVIEITGGITINNSVFSAGDLVTGYVNSASNQTITQGSGVTMRLGGTSTTGNRTATARGRFEIYFVSASECIVSGSVT